jgi:hypothetical protein
LITQSFVILRHPNCPKRARRPVVGDSPGRPLSEAGLRGHATLHAGGLVSSILSAALCQATVDPFVHFYVTPGANQAVPASAVWTARRFPRASISSKPSMAGWIATSRPVRLSRSPKNRNSRSPSRRRDCWEKLPRLGARFKRDLDAGRMIRCLPKRSREGRCLIRTWWPRPSPSRVPLPVAVGTK